MEEQPRNQVFVACPLKSRQSRGCLGCLALILALVALGITLRGFVFPPDSPGPFSGSSVAVLRVEGPINESRHIARSLKRLRENPRIRAIVVRLDTPGGAVGASEEIGREVRRAREENRKIVVASMGNAAASGGYYIAVAAQEIFANAGTLTGSIGVIGLDWNFEQTLARLGIRSVVVKSGEHKDTGSPFREMTPEDRALLQGVVHDLYRQFFRTVLAARHKEIDKALKERPERIAAILSEGRTKRAGAGIEWDAFTTGTIAAEAGATTETETALRSMADGRVFSGEQARDLGLVDRIGTLQDAIQRAGELAGLGKNPPVVEVRPGSSLPSLLGASARRFWSEWARGGSSVEYRSPTE